MTVCKSLPGHPTDWENLYTALKIVQGINVSIAGNNKINKFTLDLQLYAKCMQLRTKKVILYNYVSIPGMLHIVFAFLKAMGEYIMGS